MYIMEVYNVRLQVLHPFHEFAGSLFRCQSVAVEEARHQSVPCHIRLPSHGDGLRLARHHPVASAAVGDITLPAVRHRQFSNLLHNAAGGGVSSQHGIDLQQSFLHIYDLGMFYKLVFIHLGSVLMLGHFSSSRLYLSIL